MKRYLLIAVILPLIGLLLFIGKRYQLNEETIIPYPYVIKKDTYELDIDAPILMIGDQLATRLYNFKEVLSQRISSQMTKNIKIETLAEKNLNLPRLLAKLKSLPRLPLIILYFGNNHEEYEKLFHSASIPTINKNFELFENDIIQSLIMIKPSISRLIYTPLAKVELSSDIIEDKSDYSQIIWQKRKMIQFKIYEWGLDELFRYTQRNNSMLIPITTPLNYTLQKVEGCLGSIDSSGQEEYSKVTKLLQEKDFKQAYQTSQDLVSINNLHAPSLRRHAQISKKLNRNTESQKHYELSSIYNCNPKGSSIVYNQILKRKAEQYGTSYIDFYQMIFDFSYSDKTFLDETYPQDIYFEKLSSLLAIKIKRLLKL